MTPTLRLLPFAAADGPLNMALDEALLHRADEGRASLRFYTWTEPTVSLGYFQAAACRDETPNLRGLPWVRRATGGAAIVHHHELTYALALPKGRPWQPAGESWLCRFHRIVREVLAEFGIAARGVVCGEEAKLGAVLCFLHQTPADLTMKGSKVVGSAQRKQRGALLQHGSVLLRRSPFAPDLPGILDAVGAASFTAEVFAAALADRFAADTGWGLGSADWTAAEKDMVVRIRAEKYGSPDWNERR